MELNKTGIMQANLTCLRYHGLWPTHLNSQKDKFYRLKLIMVFCAISVLWYSATFHFISIIAGRY